MIIKDGSIELRIANLSANRIIKMLLAACLLFSPLTFAQTLELAKPVPAIILKAPDSGELIVNDDNSITIQDWLANQPDPQWTLILHIAARMNVQDINQANMDAIEAEYIKHPQFKILTILNVDDVFWGGAGFARKAFTNSAKQYRHARFVIDDASIIQSTLGLTRKSSALILLDPSKTVRFYHDGRLDPSALDRLLSTLKQGLTPQPQPQ